MPMIHVQGGCMSLMTAILDKLARWDWSKDGSVNDDVSSFEFTVTTTTTIQEPGVIREMATSALAGQIPTLPPALEGAEFVSPPDVKADLDADHDDQAPLRFCRLDDALGPTLVTGQAERVFHEELHAVSAEEPTSLEEAARHPS
jgi:hypothetical protein